MRWLSMIAIGLSAFACGTAAAQDPEFTFVQCAKTGKHIAVTPMGDYHRVHFHVRIRNCAGKSAFARVRSGLKDREPGGAKPGSAGAGLHLPRESLVTSLLEIKGNNEVWAIYLRVPRHADRTALYQIEIGELDPNEVDEFVLRTSFGWEVRRTGGEAEFVHDLGYMAVYIPVPIRSAEVVGGSVKIEYRIPVRAGGPLPLEYGFTWADAKEQVDGAEIAKRLR